MDRSTVENSAVHCPASASAGKGCPTTWYPERAWLHPISSQPGIQGHRLFPEVFHQNPVLQCFSEEAQKTSVQKIPPSY